MKNRFAYADCYKILDIDPACSWDELRRAYKLQIQKWHPDKFAENSAENDAANDKIKRITTAHQQLVAYYRRHGKLPAPETEPTSRRLPFPNGMHPATAGTSTVNNQRTPVVSKKKSSLFPVISGMMVIGLLFWYYSPTERKAPRKSIEKVNTNTGIIKPEATNLQSQYNQSASQNEPHKDTGSQSDKFITYGSTLGEVISIQGAPSRDEGNTWYYDDSELYFENGIVIGWKHMPGSKLKTRVSVHETP